MHLEFLFHNLILHGLEDLFWCVLVHAKKWERLVRETSLTK
ncbi:Uncharacterized protein BN1224_CV14_A_09700 [Chlamydia pneumoniae]|uniref:Uncharacterized protein n=1 Tax=Chlamydia pneumoniae TaxID=83558 RepID=Q9K1U9_CHLPN|nr:hypothetical protein CP_0934 [Chlamydia pneumoniae AR39]CRI33461.1 Uncharacterized protein BN1224_Wien1_A_09680 [Chlamydia pneumoniae]CRI36325.1 Uncharacterized protein BN1224_CM1_A_09720 [Chlamydia pneumoniae]CRI37451.1 Uncharacterized protein BN1224_CV14_A_09700 [Chlamydia pneumoniae]CRI38582.1 Uncharacterized protein BN1224_CV15_C_04150 [Chlamydia pneumoniae]